MTPTLISPAEAAATITRRLAASWPERVIAERSAAVQVPIEVRLRPGVTGPSAVERIGYAAWTEWQLQWNALLSDGLPGVSCETREIRVAGLPGQAPFLLRIASLEAAERFLHHAVPGGTDTGYDRERGIAAQLSDADVPVTPRHLQALRRLTDRDVQLSCAALRWLRWNPDLSGWTDRQLPVSDIDSKWWKRHARLLSELSGRELQRETRPRLAVVHLSYVDPEYLAAGGRRYDAWTAGDQHELPYQPRVVVVVENRDSRLYFPAVADTVVVEGNGSAAASLLTSIPWLAAAERLVYWGDIDSDGYAILNHLRGSFAEIGVPVESILMDEPARQRFAWLGVNFAPNGEELKPSDATLTHLQELEAVGYASVATSGAVKARRIEQERIPFDAATAALLHTLDRPRPLIETAPGRGLVLRYRSAR